MAIVLNFSQALKLFLNHLKMANVQERQIKKVSKALQGSLKRLIANELKVYPLNLNEIKKIYPKTRQYRFNFSLKRFNSFIASKPYLANVCFREVFVKMDEDSVKLSSGTLINVKQDVLKIITIDIDNLDLSRIPNNVIQDCMEGSSNYTYKYGRRFFKFLIHRNILYNTYLPVYKGKIIQIIEQAADSIEEHLNVQKACAIFLNHLWQKKTLQYSAIRVKYYNINNFSLFVGPKKRITSITRDDIICYLNHLELDRGYSRGSRASVLTNLRRFFDFFIAQKTITHNPTSTIRIKKSLKINKTVLSEDELTLIFTTAYLHYQQYEDILPKDPRITLAKWMAARDWAIVSLLICTGIRAKEVASLHIDSVDFRERVITIKGKGDHTYRVRERIIPVTEPLALSALEIYLKLRPVSVFPHLFLSRLLEPLQYTGYTLIIKNIKNKVFAKKSLTITQIRKSFINLCAEKMIDPLILKQIMGHNSLVTTMKYYLTVREQYLKEVWEKNNPLNYFSKKEFEEWMISENT